MSKRDDLRAAIEAARTPEALTALVGSYAGKQAEAIALLAKYGRCLTREHVTMILLAGVGLTDLLVNAHRPFEADRWVIEWMLNRLESEAAKQPVDTAEEILNILVRTGMFPSSSPAYARLHAIVFPTRGRETGDRAYRQCGAARVLVAHPETSTVDLERCHAVRAIVADEVARRSIVFNPQSTPAMWRAWVAHLAGATQTSRAQWQRALQDERMCRDEVCRPVLIEHAIRYDLTEGLTAFVRDARPDECAALFRELAVRAPRAALTVLAEEPSVCALLRTTDLAPLLEHQDADVRGRAITSLGLVAHVEPAGADAVAGVALPAPTDRSSRR